MILLLLFEIISIANWRLQNRNHPRMRCNNDVILLLFIIATQPGTCQWKWVVVFIAVGALIVEPWQNLEQRHFPAVVDHTKVQTCFSSLFPLRNDHFKVFRFDRLFFYQKLFFFCFATFLFVFNGLVVMTTDVVKRRNILMNSFPSCTYSTWELNFLVKAHTEFFRVKNWIKYLKFHALNFKYFSRSIWFLGIIMKTHFHLGKDSVMGRDVDFTLLFINIQAIKKFFISFT